MSDQSLRDRIDVIDVCRRMAWYMDEHSWPALQNLFTDKVILDYTSLSGGEPSSVSREELIETWRRSLSGYDAVQHLVSNETVELDGDRAKAAAMFIATHLLPNPHGGPLWTVGGEYRYRLLRTGSGWRITELAMRIAWSDGNRHIRDLAQAASA